MKSVRAASSERRAASSMRRNVGLRLAVPDRVRGCGKDGREDRLLPRRAAVHKGNRAAAPGVHERRGGRLERRRTHFKVLE